MKSRKSNKAITNSVPETPEKRAERLYAADVGPLLAWLFDEARVRGIQINEMVKQLGVTYGYINQLKSGLRRTDCIGQEFADKCAAFLGVPTIVVKMLAGRIKLKDFAWPGEGEEGMLERAFRRMRADPMARQFLPGDDSAITLEAKRALVGLYSEVSGIDVLELRRMNWILQYLQRAAMVQADCEVEAAIHTGAFQPAQGY